MTETETEKTPLQQKLDEFGQQLSKVNQPATKTAFDFNHCLLLQFIARV